MKEYWPSGRPKGLNGGNRSFPTPPFVHKNDAGLPSTGELILGRTIIPSTRLSHGERGGIVLSNSTVKAEGTGISCSADQFDLSAVRTALLLFDRIDCPSNNFIQLGPESPAGLEDWAGLQKTRVEMSGQANAAILEKMVLAAFSALDDQDSGLWSLARSAQGASFPVSSLKKDAAFRIKLQNALPIPASSVPYEDVLLFKDRCKTELMALRHYLEELALDVTKSGFGGLAETIAFEKFQKALADHASVSREANFSKTLTNLEVKFQWNELATNPSIIGAAGVAAHSISSGLPLVSAALNALVAFAPAFTVESAFGLRRKKKSGSPFEYIIQAHRQL